MPKTNDILNWHFSPTDFKYKAEHLFDEKTKRDVDNSLDKLNKLTDRLPEGGQIPEKKLIRDIYYLFQDNYYKDLLNNDLFSGRIVRTLIWALDFQPSLNDEAVLFSTKFKTALHLINSKWRDSFFISLSHVFLKNWSSLKQFENNRDLLEHTLSEKGGSYSGTRKDIHKLTSRTNLFLDSESAVNYAIELIENNIPINKANLILEQKEHILSYEFFSEVSNKYIDLITNANLKKGLAIGVYQFLEIHNKKKTTLLLCSKIINKDSFKNYIDLVKNETVKLIADPVKSHLWKHSELNLKEQQAIENARKKLNILLNKKFIQVFFEKLVEDDRRKRYWLRFIDKIDDIKFSGNRSNYQYLKNIESVSKYVDHRFKVTSRNQNTCALIIYSKDYVFVEFTDTGALYIYKNKNFRVNLNSINGMEDLKTWSRYDYACKNSDYGGYVDLWEEGRITHQGNWEMRVNAWMKEYYND